jgi:hypothetical protein
LKTVVEKMQRYGTNKLRLMFNWFKKRPAAAIGPDFSLTNTKEKAEAQCQRGELEKLHLLPPEFGGTEDPRNIVFVPSGFAAIKADVDKNIIKPLIADGKVTRYEAVPEYDGKSFVPIAIKIVVSNPSSFMTNINIWGKALQRGTNA